MYTWQKKMDIFETYVLGDGSGTTYVEVVPDRGSIVSRYVYKGKDVFYLDEATLHDSSKNIRGGNPILFPISSYLTDETYTFEGKAYSMKQHGFARNLKGTVTEVRADEQSASLTLVMEDLEETLARYPFHFRLVMTYRLDAEGLQVEAQVENKDSKTMPFYLGYHPYFHVEDKTKLALDVPSTSYSEMVEHSMAGGQFNLGQAESTVIFDELTKPFSVLHDEARGLKVTVRADENFRHVVLWTLKDKPFVCVEPWMAPVDALNTGIGVQQLAPGESRRFVIGIQPELV